MTSPFTPPGSRLADQMPRAGSPLKAVILGLLVDVGGSIAAGVLMTAAYAASLASSGVGPDGITQALEHLPGDSWLSIAGMVIGGLFSVLGGYVCARVARRSEFALGAVLGALSIGFGIWAGAGRHSVWFEAVLSLLTFLAVMFGVRLGAARNERA